MKKILLSLMTLVLVVGMVGGGAFAYFSDTETSEDNLFTAGTLDLQIDKNPDGAIFEWVDDPDVPVMNDIAPLEALINNMKPGDEVMVIVGIKNAGTIAGTADIHIKNVVDADNGQEEPEPATSHDGDLSRAVDVTISYGDKSVIGDTWGMWTYVTSGKLFDLDCVNIDAPVPMGAGDDDYWVLEFSIATTVENEIMGDTVEFGVEFTLHQ